MINWYSPCLSEEMILIPANPLPRVPGGGRDGGIAPPAGLLGTRPVVPCGSQGFNMGLHHSSSLKSDVIPAEKAARVAYCLSLWQTALCFVTVRPPPPHIRLPSPWKRAPLALGV